MRVIYTRIKGDNVTPLFKEERRKKKGKRRGRKDRKKERRPQVVGMYY